MTISDSKNMHVPNNSQPKQEMELKQQNNFTMNKRKYI